MLIGVSFSVTNYSTFACQDQNVIINVNGCDYLVSVCVNCTIGVAPTSLSVKNFMKLDVNCTQSLSPQKVLQSIKNQISTYDYIYSNLCLENGYVPPPCPNLPLPDKFFYQYHYLCFKKTYVLYFGEWHEKYEACDYDNYCLEEVIYCFTTVPFPHIKKVVNDFILVGSPNCTLESWEAEVDECYIIHTPCNP
ncbi:MAG TPA: hypothetical protein PLE30_11285 [Candidatus Kapabacteria bacterium]|nr:hypothetical protein [Candidatus Kapabacteria bacterium]